MMEIRVTDFSTGKSISVEKLKLSGFSESNQSQHSFTNDNPNNHMEEMYSLK